MTDPTLPALLLRMIQQTTAHQAITMTETEWSALDRHLHPGASIIIDGNPLDIRALPRTILPDLIEDLPELDDWRNMVHQSRVDGLLNDRDVAILWNRHDS